MPRCGPVGAVGCPPTSAPLTRSSEAGKESNEPACPHPADPARPELSVVEAPGKLLLDAEAIRRTLTRIAHEIIERNDDLGRVALVGIHTRGVPLAHRLRRLVDERSGLALPVGSVDITFYRDDVQLR